jgi:intracellular sulfur oxidation DsrE/DsrF family protein
MRTIGIWIAALAAVVLAATTAAANERYGKQKVVYHINYGSEEDGQSYRAAMQNIQNHINAVGAANIEVKVVLHGNGLNLLRAATSNEKIQGQVVSLKAQNVGFQVCDNTLKGRKINYERDLFEVFKEDIVPSGVAEIARLQQMGYVYIKP